MNYSVKDSNTTANFGQLSQENFYAEYLRLIQADLADAQANLEELPESQRRGLTMDTLKHFHCGYLQNWILTKSLAEFSCGLYVDKVTGEPKRLPPPSERIIIPTAGGKHFNAAATPCARRTMEKRFWKQHAGKMELFCDPDALNAELIVVVEGEFDAMSIWQASQGKISSVAVLACENWKKTLLPRLNELKGKKFLILFDADEAGKKGSKTLREELIGRGYPAVSKTFFDDALPQDDKNEFGQKVDANDILKQKGDAYLNALLERIIKNVDFAPVQAQIAELQKNPFGEGSEPDIAVNPSNRDLTHEPARTLDFSDFKPTDTDRDKISMILKDFVHAKDLSRDEWFIVGCVMKRYGFSFEDFQIWSNDGDKRYSAADCVSQWNSIKPADELNGKGYTIATLIELAKNYGFEPSKKNDIAAQINKLNAQLKEIAKALDDFDAEKDAALENLRNVETFDSDTVFADSIVTAAAFAKLFDKQAYSNFRRDMKNFGDKHKDKKVRVYDWTSAVNDKVNEIKSRQNDLLTRQNEIQAQITSLSFISKDDTLRNFSFPYGYSISEDGIKKIVGKDLLLVCRRPVIVSAKNFSVEDNISKLQLAVLATKGKWKKIPPTEKAIVFSSRRIVDLANNDLPVTSNTATLLVDYLDAFNAQNENNFPLTYIVPRCGWYKDEQLFVHPSRNCVFIDDDKNISVEVDSRSQFAHSLRQVGSLVKWKQAYELAKKFPVARLMISAAVAPPLLKILHERNFLLYVYAPTRAGKTTALYLAASAVGDEKIVRSFDATKNGLLGAAADVNDFPFLIDEKQVADNRLKEQLDNLVYALANGLGRTKLTKDSTLRKTLDWRTIAVMTGETQLLADNVTGGAKTRLLSIAAPKAILPSDTCRDIRDIIKDNFGHAFCLVLDKIFSDGQQKLRDLYSKIVDSFEKEFPNILPDHCRYVAVLTLADALLNSALGIKSDIAAYDDAFINALAIFKLIPTVEEISDTNHERDFVLNFIAQNQSKFINGNVDIKRMQAIWGELRCNDDFSYISVQALKDACKIEGFDYRKLVADLIEDGFFIPADTIEKGREKPLNNVKKRLAGANSRCFRMRNFWFPEINS